MGEQGCGIHNIAPGTGGIHLASMATMVFKVCLPSALIMVVAYSRGRTTDAWHLFCFASHALCTWRENGGTGTHTPAYDMGPWSFPTARGVSSPRAKREPEAKGYTHAHENHPPGA